MNSFSEKTLRALSPNVESKYYVYGLIDPRERYKTFFYIGKGEGNRIFSHEIESRKNGDSEKKKIEKIRAIESEGLEVEKVIICSNLTEKEAFAAEASLINAFRFLDDNYLVNIVSGHHSERAFTAEEFEQRNGAEDLDLEYVHHNLLVIKINRLHDKIKTERELYDAVRGLWRASLKRVATVDYVLGVYNSLIVAVFKPSEWFIVGLHPELLCDSVFHKPDETNKNRLFFVDKEFEELLNKPDSKNMVDLYFKKSPYYLKTIAKISTNQKSQNPITYIYGK